MKAIHHLRVLDDRTDVLLVEGHGDRTQLETTLEDQPGILSYDISETDNVLYTHVHQKLSETVVTLLRIPQEHELIVDTPMAYTDDGALRVTLLGEQKILQEALSEIPDEMELSVEVLGQFQPEQSGFSPN